MSTAIYRADAAGWSAAIVTLDPKHIWHDGERIVVYTGADIPPVPEPEPVMIREDEAIRAIKRVAPTTTDRQAREAIDAERVTLGVEAETLRA